MTNKTQTPSRDRDWLMFWWGFFFKYRSFLQTGMLLSRVIMAHHSNILHRFNFGFCSLTLRFWLQPADYLYFYFQPSVEDCEVPPSCSKWLFFITLNSSTSPFGNNILSALVGEMAPPSKSTHSLIISTLKALQMIRCSIFLGHKCILSHAKFLRVLSHLICSHLYSLMHLVNALCFSEQTKKVKAGEGKRKMDGRLNPCVCTLCSGWEQMSRGSVLWPALHCVRQTSLLIQLDQATLYSTAGGHIIALYKTSGRIKWDNAEVVSVCVLYSTKCNICTNDVGATGTQCWRRVTV